MANFQISGKKMGASINVSETKGDSPVEVAGFGENGALSNKKGRDVVPEP